MNRSDAAPKRVLLAGEQLNELHFDDLFAITDYEFSSEKRRCSFCSSGAILLRPEPLWLGPGRVVISDWVSAQCLRLNRNQDWVDYPLTAEFCILNLRELLVSESGNLISGDGGNIDEFWYKYEFKQAKIVADFSLKDLETPISTQQHWLAKLRRP